MNSPLYGLVPSILKFLDFYPGNDRKCLMPNNIRKWINGIVDKSLLELKQSYFEYGILNILRSASGPATTLHIHLESGFKIDFDLAPVFTFSPENLEFYDELWENIDTSNGGPSWIKSCPTSIQRNVRKVLSNDFFVVPKPSSKLVFLGKMSMYCLS